MTRPYYVVFGLLSVILSMSGGRAAEIPSGDAEFLRKQELVFQLLWSTRDAPKNHPEVFERVRNYKIEDVAAACENHTYAKEFEAHLLRSSLALDQPFSAYRDEQLDEVRPLYEVLRCARGFDDFAALAAWSSLHVNELAWLHALALAMAHRPDTRQLRMPNLYEIVPHYFFNTEVMVQAYRAKTGEIAGIADKYTINANYTNHQFSQSSPGATDSQLAYFREDVGLNEFYFHLATSLPFWLGSDDPVVDAPKHLRGELYHHAHKTLLARYELERLSHGLGRIEDIDWEQGIATGYRSSMTHLNGWLMPSREPGARVPPYKYKFLEEVKHYESRLSKAIDLGELRSTSSDYRAKKLYEPGSETSAFNELCNALEGNADSPQPKFYGSLERSYRRILGFASEPVGRRVGMSIAALEMPMASLRDPGFYMMYKRIVNYGLRFKRNLPPYKLAELGFDGVRVDYVHLDNRLVTYFHAFESTLNHPRVLHLHEDSSSHQESTSMPQIVVKARQQRLNHKAFGYQIGINSERAIKGVVRVFLGPKSDVHGNELELEESLEEFYELDRWIVELKQGSNKLERSSTDSVYYAADPVSSDAYDLEIARALRTSDDNLARELVTRGRSHRGLLLPRRLLLPRGRSSGLGLRMIVCLHAGEGNGKVEQLSEAMVFGKLMLDGRALGFPLDRQLKDADGFRRLRNFMVKDVKVYHEELKDVEKD